MDSVCHRQVWGWWLLVSHAIWTQFLVFDVKAEFLSVSCRVRMCWGDFLPVVVKQPLAADVALSAPLKHKDFLVTEDHFRMREIIWNPPAELCTNALWLQINTDVAVLFSLWMSLRLLYLWSRSSFGRQQFETQRWDLNTNWFRIEIKNKIKQTLKKDET